MKKILIAVFALALFACGEQNKKDKNADVAEKATSEEKVSETTPKKVDGYLAYGETINATEAISSEAMYEKYKDLEVGDTIEVKFSAPVASVCKKMGCWMKLKLDEGEQTRVTFKDYGFFVPKDIENKEVIVHGKAFIKEVSVEDLKHYAEDEGKSEAEIAAITEPKQTLAFTADGVLVEE
jgi:hypothetical protein